MIPEIQNLGQYTFIDRSLITVVNGLVNIFIKAGGNSKMTYKHAAECSKAAYLGVNL